MEQVVEVVAAFKNARCDEWEVHFPADHITTTVPLTPVDESMYRVDGVPLLCSSAGFGDVVEAEPVGDRRLRFLRVVEAAGWQTYYFVVSPSKPGSDWGQLLLSELEARGGYWELVFGGLLIVCIPPDVCLDPTPWVETL